MKKLLLAALCLMIAAPAFAQVKPWKVYAGANAVWFDDNVSPSDFELGGTARASLQPHLALVGSAWYGLDKNYIIGQGGVRITVSDVENPDFSIGLGIQYRASSKPEIRSEEWVPDVSLGFKPWPVEMPNVVLGVQAGYGLTTNQAHALVAFRYYLTQF